MRVLITGGAGYIGSHAVRQLARQGHEVVVYDNLSTGHLCSVEGYECIIADIADQEKLRLALRGVDAVMHFAAFSRVPESVSDPRKYFENNLRSGLSLLSAVLEANTPYFILSSTCAVYGLPSEMPISENTPRVPINPYGISKFFLEQALEAYNAAYGLRFVSLRYFNAAGADENCETGEMHEPETHLIPCALAVAAGFRPQIDVYGSDYPTPDGTCIRDYVHVSDLSEAHALALDYLTGGGLSGAFNLGIGKGFSVLEVLSAAEEVTGHAIRKQWSDRRPVDPPVLIADARRAVQDLRWTPKRSLHDMVKSAWNFMQVRLEKESVITSKVACKA